MLLIIQMVVILLYQLVVCTTFTLMNYGIYQFNILSLNIHYAAGRITLCYLYIDGNQVHGNCYKTPRS